MNLHVPIYLDKVPIKTSIMSIKTSSFLITESKNDNNKKVKSKNPQTPP